MFRGLRINFLAICSVVTRYCNKQKLQASGVAPQPRSQAPAHSLCGPESAFFDEEEEKGGRKKDRGNPGIISSLVSSSQDTEEKESGILQFLQPQRADIHV